jgi:nicotinamidase/pyrazinamidase
VKFTAMDALKFGFKVRIVEDACRGINLSPEDVKNAIVEMKEAGVMVLQSADILAEG